MPRRLPSVPAAPRTYAELKRSVEDALVRGLQRVEGAKLRTYWETGRLIHEHLFLFRERADYGAQIVARLEEDLKISERVLYRCLHFHRAYPIPTALPELTWMHYCALMRVEDPARRKALTNLAVREAWTSRQLEEHVAQLLTPTPDDVTAPTPNSTPRSISLLKPKRGTPGHYPVVNRPDGPSLDLGFKVYLPLAFRPEPVLRKLAAGDIVHADADHPPALASDATKADLYTYRTSAVRVVDGDTLAVTIDLPPFNRLDKKLRLRGLNCPEMDTDAGKAAKRYVQSLVDRADEVVITITKPDKYDRYLADVFLLGLKDDNSAVTPRSELTALSSSATASDNSSQVTSHSSLFLNNSLLANGHAVPMGDDAQPVVV